ncbi:hypothetical protein F4774DRAFT_366919 [Daldinia eschscholtzii]|nr:hypothetical protein F4774DRAFT_366919 [Daldinia eschscholtzii]
MRLCIFEKPRPSLLEIPPPRFSDLATDHRQEVDQETFSMEGRLDVLFNRPGVVKFPRGCNSAQRYELQIGTNSLEPFLAPTSIKTAKVAPKDSHPCRLPVIVLLSRAHDPRRELRRHGQV